MKAIDHWRPPEHQDKQEHRTRFASSPGEAADKERSKAAKTKESVLTVLGYVYTDMSGVADELVARQVLTEENVQSVVARSNEIQTRMTAFLRSVLLEVVGQPIRTAPAPTEPVDTRPCPC